MRLSRKQYAQVWTIIHGAYLATEIAALRQKHAEVSAGQAVQALPATSYYQWFGGLEPERKWAVAGRIGFMLFGAWAGVHLAVKLEELATA